MFQAKQISLILIQYHPEKQRTLREDLFCGDTFSFLLVGQTMSIPIIHMSPNSSRWYIVQI